MAQTFVDYTVTSPVGLSYSFGSRVFLAPEHIHVYVQDVSEGGDLAETTDFTTSGGPGALSITLNGPTAAALGPGDTVRIRRITPVDAPLVDFAPGSLRSDDLDTGYLHTLYAVEESKELVSVENAMLRSGSLPDYWDGDGLRIKDLQDGADATDAVTLRQLEDATFASGVLTYEQSQRVDTAMPYAIQERPRVIQLAQGNSWTQNDEGWMLRQWGDLDKDYHPLSRRPIGAFVVPAIGAANGAYIEARMTGEALHDGARCIIELSSHPDIESGDFVTNELASYSTPNGGRGPIEVVLRLYPQGRHRTLVSWRGDVGYGDGAGVSTPSHEGLGVTTAGTPVTETTQRTWLDGTMAHNTATPQFRIAGSLGNTVNVGDTFTISDGKSTRIFEFGTLTTGNVKVTHTDTGVPADDAITNCNALAAAIHNSRLRIRAIPEEPAAGTGVIWMSALKSAGHLYTGDHTITAGGSNTGTVTLAVFNVQNGADWPLDWFTDQEFYIAARPIPGDGVVINTFSVIQYGCTKGWEPRQ